MTHGRLTASMLVSLGSPRMTDDALRALCAAAHRDRADDLVVCLLDRIERINLRALYGLPDDIAEGRVKERCLRIRRAIASTASPRLTVLSLEDLDGDVLFRQLDAWTADLYANNRQFRDACQNESFHSLDPILRRLGIHNRRAHLVETLAQYVVIELALKLFLVERYDVTVEFSLAHEMSVARRTFGGDYGPPPGRSLPKPPQHQVVSCRESRPELAVKDLSFAYHDDADKSFALSQVSFSVSAGSTLGVLGPSGAGKSTLLQLIAGHAKPDGGTINFDGRPLNSVPVGKRGIVTVFQDNALFPYLSVEENVAFPVAARGGFTNDEVHALAAIYMERMRVAHRGRLPARNLSGGEAQRVAVARALVCEPGVLLLDEPVAGADHLWRATLGQLLAQALSAPPVPIVVLVSHDLDFVFSLCTHILLLDNGRVEAFGPRRELLSCPPTIRAAQLLGTHSWLRGRMDGNTFTFKGIDGTEKLVELLSAGSSGHREPAYLTIPICAVRPAHHGSRVGAALRGTVIRTAVVGSSTRVMVQIGSQDGPEHVVRMDVAGYADVADWPVGATVDVDVDVDQCGLLTR